jgi:hypothetical protein
MVISLILIGLALAAAPLICFLLGASILIFSRVTENTRCSERPFYGLYMKILQSQGKIRNAQFLLKSNHMRALSVFKTVALETAKILWNTCKVPANV